MSLPTREPTASTLAIGKLKLTRAAVDEFTADTLLSAYQQTAQPGEGFIELAAVGLYLTGPADWPSMRPGLDYVAYGRLMHAYLSARDISTTRCRTIGRMAIERYARDRGSMADEMKEAADFFGVILSGSTDAGSPESTPETPSEG